MQIDLKYAWAPILADLSLFSNGIIPNNYGGESETAFYNHPIGTGPFEWDVWKKGQYIKLVKNPHYWQPGKPYLNSVTFDVVPDASTRQLQLEGNQANIDTSPDWSTFATLKSTPGITATAFPSTEIDYLAFNEKVAPFNDVHVRQAISDAINRNALVDAVLFGNGKAANSLFMPGLPYYDATGGETYNLAAAKKALAESSKPHGFTTTLQIASGNANESAAAQIVQSELQPLGITVNIQQLDPTAAHASLEADTFDMAYSLWTMDIPDPDEWTSFATDPERRGRVGLHVLRQPDRDQPQQAGRAGNRPGQAVGPVRPAAAADLTGRVPRVPVLPAVRLRHHGQRARVLRHAARQLPPGKRVPVQLTSTISPRNAGPAARRRPRARRSTCCTGCDLFRAGSFRRSPWHSA